MAGSVSRALFLGTTVSLAPPSRQTARTRPTTTATSVASQDIVCAVSESRGIASTVGLAFINICTAETVLCQICDSQTYVKTVTKVTVFEPTEILFMSTVKDSKLFYIIQENFRDTTLTFADRRFWSEKTGHEYVDRLAFPEDIESIKVTLGGNYFAACCFAAVLKYVELELDWTFAPRSLRIRFEPSQGSMSIDLSTIVSLELIQNLQNPKSKESHFGLMNATQTPMGSRLLRANILQPSTEESKLLARYDAVEDLSTKEEMFLSVRKALKGFVDADKVLSSLTTKLILVPTRRNFQYVEQCVNNVIMLKTFVSSIKNIYRSLGTAQSSLLLTIREICAPSGHRAVEDMIDFTLNEHVAYQTKPLDLRNQRIYCVRAGVNSLLDVARQTYKEANMDAAELVSKIQETHDIALDLKYDTARQFYISISASEIATTLPDVFINVYRKKNRIECQTLDLVKLNQKIVDAHNEVLNMSDQTIQDLIVSVCSSISHLFKVSEAIGLLDMLAAFAHLASTHDYIRPELTDTLALKSARNPIREKIHAKKFVPNDAYATDISRFQIITGCNMSGKSTYIRTIALTTVMAQTGSFVPAAYASGRIASQLFARVSTADDLAANVSTFAAEMRDMSRILRALGPRALVIVDELGRGTATTDGLAIALAIAEALIESRARVWFATHFHDLAVILAERSGVVSLHLAADLAPDASKMTMLYRVAEGPDMTHFYGLALAKLVDLPAAVLDFAQDVSAQMNEIVRRRQSHSRAAGVTRKRNLILALREQLVQEREGNMSGDGLRCWLRRLQDEFALKMAAIDQDVAAFSKDGDGQSVTVQRREIVSDREQERPDEERSEDVAMGERSVIEISSDDASNSGTSSE
ncbi:putative DNA mismatch repair protein Msh4 [Aspergillus floccosus]